MQNTFLLARQCHQTPFSLSAYYFAVSRKPPSEGGTKNVINACIHYRSSCPLFLYRCSLESGKLSRGGKNIPAALSLEWTSSVWQISHSAERNPLRLYISPASRTPSQNTERLIHSADGACKQRRLQNTSCSHCHYLLDLKVTTRTRFKLAGKIKAARTDTHTHSLT